MSHQALKIKNIVGFYHYLLLRPLRVRGGRMTWEDLVYGHWSTDAPARLSLQRVEPDLCSRSYPCTGQRSWPPLQHPRSALHCIACNRVWRRLGGDLSCLVWGVRNADSYMGPWASSVSAAICSVELTERGLSHCKVGAHVWPGGSQPRLCWLTSDYNWNRCSRWMPESGWWILSWCLASEVLVHEWADRCSVAQTLFLVLRCALPLTHDTSYSSGGLTEQTRIIARLGWCSNKPGPEVFEWD